MGEKTLIVDMYHTFTKSVEKSKKIIDRLIDSFMFKEMLLFSYATSSTLHPRGCVGVGLGACLKNIN